MHREGETHTGSGDAGRTSEALGAQQWRVREAVVTLELLRGALASTASEMRWRSPAAEHFHRRAEIQLSNIDGLIRALEELDEGMRRARRRLLAQAGAAG